MSRATFYGVSVGPGDPELLTRKAVRVIERCPVIAAPQTGGGRTLALDIVSQAVDLCGKVILPLSFLMTRDPEALAQSHRQEAARVMAQLERGRDVAMLNLGDASIYSTFSYLLELISAEGYPTEVVPGVPSFCAVAALLETSLTTMKQPLHIIPAGYQGVGEGLDLPGTKVLMKTGKAMPQVRQALEERGMLEKAAMVQNCGLPDQRICRDLRQAGDDISYFTTILVKE